MKFTIKRKLDYILHLLKNSELLIDLIVKLNIEYLLPRKTVIYYVKNIYLIIDLLFIIV